MQEEAMPMGWKMLSSIHPGFKNLYDALGGKPVKPTRGVKK
jgi:hypothetical protein